MQNEPKDLCRMMRNDVQFRIRKISDTDETTVKDMVDNIAHRYSMEENTVTSLAERTIVHYTERIGFGYALGARGHDSIILVEASAGRTQSSGYEELVSDLSRELRGRFADSCAESAEADWIPITNAKVTPEHAERIRVFHKQRP